MYPHYFYSIVPDPRRHHDPNELDIEDHMTNWGHTKGVQAPYTSLREGMIYGMVDLYVLGQQFNTTHSMANSMYTALEVT